VANFWYKLLFNRYMAVGFT